MRLKTVLIAVAVVAAGAGIFVARRLAHGSGDAEPADEAVPTVVTVQTGKLQRATLRAGVEGFGSVAPAPAEAGQPAAGTRLAAPVAGVVAQVNVLEGQRVNPGDVLFQLDSRVADVAVEFARKTLERQQKLLETNNTSQKAVQEARQQLAAAEVQQALLRVAAPLAGTVTRVNVRPGEAVDSATVLAEITDLGRLVVVSSIPSVEAGALKAGQVVELLTDPPANTALAYVSPTVDAASATVLVRAPAPAAAGLRPGQWLKLRIVTDEHANCLVAPAGSVVADADGHDVIAVVAGDEATQVRVKTGLRQNDLVEVEGEGLKEGTPVVTLGAYGLPGKTKVHVAAP